MELATISVDRKSAREAFLEYRASVRALTNREMETYDQRKAEAIARQREQDEAIMRGYRLLSLGRQIIDLRQTVVAGGVDEQHRPKLAIARADMTAVSLQVNADGSAEFRGRTADGWLKSHNFTHRDARTLGRITFGTDTFPRWAGSPTWFVAEAIAPIIPPRFRPAQLDRYHVLWEAEWRPERAPVDPALLRALGGGLYAVVAVWDLTPLEQAVLAMRQSA